MPRHLPALLAAFSHAAAGCQALHLARRAHGDNATDLGAGEAPHDCMVWGINGRLGNQFSAIGDALFVAEMCGTPCVHVSELQQSYFKDLLDLPVSLDVARPYRDDHRDAGDLCRQARNQLEWMDGTWGDPPPLDWTKLIFHRRLWPLLALPMVDGLYRDDTLVVHLRGGDVLNMKNADERYMPAPCEFYGHVMKRGYQGKPFKDVIAISNDLQHPCLSLIESYKEPQQRLVRVFAPDQGIRHGPRTAFRYDPQSHTRRPVRATAEEDFMLLVSAKNIALSTSSTFGFAGLMMNPHDTVNVFMPTYKGIETCCDGNFKLSRLDELCHIGKGSKIYELPFPTGYNKTYKDRKRWMMFGAFPINASTDIHGCGGEALAGAG